MTPPQEDFDARQTGKNSNPTTFTAITTGSFEH